MPEFNDPWRLKEKKPLGKGGQGSAYLVEHGDSKEIAVAKVLSGNHQPESPRWKRIEEEIQVSRSFDHPHVIRVLDSGHTKGKGFPYYVMPSFGLQKWKRVPRIRGLGRLDCRTSQSEKRCHRWRDRLC